MSSLPKLTEADIRTWVGETSLARGRPYARNGSILTPRRQGNTLKAQCVGSAATPYRVAVVLDAKAIASAHCSCPVGSGGHCKHVAALLLGWVTDPDTFMVMEELATLLNQHSKEELIALITKMIDRYPDLERLLTLSIVTGNSTAPVDPKVIERQVEQVFKQLNGGYDGYGGYGADNGMVHELTEIKSLGDQYATAQDWHNAVTVYKTVMASVLDNYEMLGDEDGEFDEVANACVAGLGICLAAAADEPLRQMILRALFDVQLWDIQWGGIDMGHEAPDLILTYATPAERTTVATWVHAELAKTKGLTSSWGSGAWGSFLLGLQEEKLDDETFLQICRESGLHLELVERLLDLGRTAEAVAATDTLDVHELLAMTSLFAAHHLVDRFAQVVVAHAKRTEDRRLKIWLKEYAIAQNDPARALQLVEELFWAQPNLAEYQELKQLAQRLQKWPKLQTEIYGRLAADPQQQTLLTHIYLLEGDIDAALRMLQQPAKSPWDYGPQMLKLEIAHAAEATHPQAAIDIYQEQVYAQIAQRNRSSYAIAAEYLVRLRVLYQSIDNLAAWQKLLGEIRTNNSRLRALHDELRSAGL